MYIYIVDIALFNKLIVHVFNNMKCSSKNKLDLKADDGAIVVIKYIENKQFITNHPWRIIY